MAGDSGYIYVRYCYYHGVQFPTAILASGAGPFFDGNRFTTAAEAQTVGNMQKEEWKSFGEHALTTS